MTVTSTGTLRRIAEESGSDPRGAIWNAVGDVDGIQVAARHLLVAQYIRPEKTKGGIYRPDRSLAEDRFQGKVGLVLKMGPLCFENDTVNDFGGFKAEPGDWVIFRTSDGWENFLTDGSSGTPVRWFVDTSIIGITDNPERIY